MSDERVEDLKIAVSEATTNAIVAHQSADEVEPVVLTFGATTGESFGVTIVDTGPGFDPAAADGDGRDWTDESGLGVTIIRGLADEVEFMRGEGMRVNMRFAVGLTSATNGGNGGHAS